MDEKQNMKRIYMVMMVVFKSVCFWIIRYKETRITKNLG